MRRSIFFVLAIPLLMVFALVMGLQGSTAVDAASPDADARVRVAHMSPDAPEVDVWVDGSVAFSGVAFGELTDYATLPTGDYLVQVEPAGNMGAGPFVISATLSLSDTDYTVAATDVLSTITPVVLEDDNSAPMAGMSHVRFVHASPDAPAVDITLPDGTVLFGDYEFQEFSSYLPVAAGNYDLEVRLAGTDTVVLSLPGLTFNDGTVYSVFAAGFAGGGTPGLTAFLSADSGTSNVRVAHLSPDAPNVDVWVNGSPAFINVPFEGVTNYAGLPFGDYLVQVVGTGDPLAPPYVISATLSLGDSDYTVAATDVLTNITPIVLADDNSSPAARTSHVRFFHGSPDAPAVDITLTDGTVLFGNIAFQEASAYLPVSAGVYDLEVRLAGTPTVALSLPGIDLRDGTVYTVFATGFAVGGPPPLNAVLVADSGTARVRVAHASPDAPNVDVWVNGSPVYTDVAYTEITSYAGLPFGEYLVQVEAAGDPLAAPYVISATLNLTDSDYTVAATDVVASITPIVLMDNNSEPAYNAAHVRFVHASPDAPAVDIAVTGGPVLFPDYEFQEASGYLPVAPGSYDLEVRLEGTSTVVLTVPGVVLEDGNVYTIFAMGLAGGGTPVLEAVPSLDAEFWRLFGPVLFKDAPAP